MPDRVRVSSAEFVRNIGQWQERALEHPVSITHHGRERLVLTSSARYSQLTTYAAADVDAEQRLGSASAAHDGLVSHISEGYLVLDHDAKCLEINRAARAFFGVGVHDLIGKRIEAAFPAIAGSTISREIGRVMSTRVEVTFEADSNVTHGARLQICAYPHPAGVAITFVNLTEQRALEHALEVAQARLSAASAHPKMAMVDLNTEGRITTADDTFEAWTGFTGAALIGIRIADIVSNADKPALTKALKTVIAQRAPQRLTLDVVGKTHEVPMCVSVAALTERMSVRGMCLAATLNQSA